jgi:hypothetical protein
MNVRQRFLLPVILTLAALPFVVAGIAVGVLWGIHQWNAPIWLLALIGCGLLVGLSYVAWRAARILANRGLKFSLREMLIGMAVAALLLSTVGRWLLVTFHQQRAIQEVQFLGGEVGDHARRAEERNWLSSRMGYDPFDRVQSLRFTSDQAIAAAIEKSDQFPDIALLGFRRGVSTAGFEQAENFNRFPKLWIGEFFESSIDDQGLQHLGKWTNVQDLFFNGCPNVTDAGLRHLVGLPNLEKLSLIEEGGGMVISDAGLVQVGRMKRLKFLILVNFPQVTDAGLLNLHGLNNLEYIVARRTGVTEEGLKQLYKALPDCRAVADVFVPGAAEVQKIAVRKIGQPDERVYLISDSDRIGKIRLLLKECDEFAQNYEWLNDPWPATFRLQFMGRTRVLYEVCVGNGTLQKKLYKVSSKVPDSWAKSQISDAQESQFINLMEFTGDE